jgi:hypothetical protein
MLVNFSMMQHYGYSLTELEQMMPWEREIYKGLLTKFLKDQEMQMRRQQNGA